jgi:hypothetical protein
MPAVSSGWSAVSIAVVPVPVPDIVSQRHHRIVKELSASQSRLSGCSDLGACFESGTGTGTKRSFY